MAFLTQAANRGSVSTGYDIDNSAAFGGANGIQFNPSSDGNRRTWTVSLWVKRSELSVETTIFGSSNTAWAFMDSDWLRFGLHTGSAMYYYDTDNTGTVFRDTSAWYHLVFQLDTTQGTAANRTKLYINGALYTGARGGADTSANIPQNTEMTMSLNTSNIQVGYFYAGGEQLDGYMSEIHFTDGVANDADAFGEYDDDSGIWKPKVYAGSYGTNGFYLEFKESASSSTGIGKDTSGNGHNFSTGGAYPSQATDTPTNNFCTLNPLFAGFQSTVQLPSNGATQYGLSGGNQDLSYAGTMGVTKGKWYFENYINEVVSTYGARIYVGFHTFQDDYDGVQYGASTKGDAIAVWQMDAGNYVAWNGGSRSITGSLGTVNSSGAGKYVGIALNLDDNQITFYYDGSAITNGSNLALYNMGTQTDAGTFAIPVVQTKGSIQTVNFGGYTGATISSAQSDENGYGTFEHAPPSGYYSLCTKNLAEYG